jgi:hypothetical protein
MKRLLSRVGILFRVGIKDMTTNYPLQLRMKFTRQGRISMNVRHQLNSKLMVAEVMARSQAVVGQSPVQVFMILIQKVEVIECCISYMGLYMSLFINSYVIQIPDVPSSQSQSPVLCRLPMYNVDFRGVI